MTDDNASITWTQRKRHMECNDRLKEIEELLNIVDRKFKAEKILKMTKAERNKFDKINQDIDKNFEDLKTNITNSIELLR